MFSNQIIMAVLKHGCSMIKSQDKWLNFLKKNNLNNVDLLFRLLIFWSRNIWKRSKLSENNCEYIRKVILNIISESSEEKTKLIKVCSQNLVSLALNKGSLGIDQAACAITEDIIENLFLKNEFVNTDDENGEQKKKQVSKPVVQDNEMKLLDSLGKVLFN